MLFKTIDLVLNPLPFLLIHLVKPVRTFRFFLNNKVLDIKASFKPSTFDRPVSCLPTDLLTCFHPISSIQLADILVFEVKSSSCESDVIPARLFKEVFATLSPAITAIINNYLANGVVPASFKHALVHPLLKKPHLDTSILSNFRPIYK